MAAKLNRNSNEGRLCYIFAPMRALNDSLPSLISNPHKSMLGSHINIYGPSVVSSLVAHIVRRAPASRKRIEKVVVTRVWY